MIQITVFAFLFDMAVVLAALALRTKHRVATALLLGIVALVNVTLLVMFVLFWSIGGAPS